MNSNKLKKIIYSILKEILEGENVPKAADYEITDEQYFEILQLMKDEGYLNPKKSKFLYKWWSSYNKSIGHSYNERNKLFRR